MINPSQSGLEDENEDKRITNPSLSDDDEQSSGGHEREGKGNEGESWGDDEDMEFMFLDPIPF
jgi:hypothetical protein